MRPDTQAKPAATTGTVRPDLTTGQGPGVWPRRKGTGSWRQPTDTLLDRDG